jgi:hypothetical protein
VTQRDNFANVMDTKGSHVSINETLSVGRLVKEILRDDLFGRAEGGAFVLESGQQLYTKNRIGGPQADPHSEYRKVLEDRKSNGADKEYANHDRLIVLLGNAGTGKTSFLLYHWLIEEKCDVASTSTQINSGKGATGGLVLFYVDLKLHRYQPIIAFWKSLWNQLRVWSERQFGVGFFSRAKSRVFDEFLKQEGQFEQYYALVYANREKEAFEILKPHLTNPEHCVRAVLHYLSCRPADFENRLIIAIDNGDLNDEAAEKELCLFAISLASFDPDSSFRTGCIHHVVCALRDETYDVFGTQDIAYPIRTIRILAPDDDAVLVRRSDALFAAVRDKRLSLDAAVTVRASLRPDYRVWQNLPILATAKLLSSMLRWQLEKLPLLRVEDRRLLQTLTKGSTRRLMGAFQNLLSNRGVQAESVLDALRIDEVSDDPSSPDFDTRSGDPEGLRFTDDLSRSVINRYAFVDGVICGGGDAFGTDQRTSRIVTNVFEIPGGREISDTSIICLPVAMQFLLLLATRSEEPRSVIAYDDLLSWLIRFGFPGNLPEQAITELAKARMIIKVSRGVSALYRISPELISAHLDLLGTAAYIDNMAQGTPSFGVPVSLTTGYNDADFPKRVAQAIDFIEFIRVSESSFLLKDAVYNEWRSNKLWSIWHRVVSGYRDRLSGLCSAGRVPSSVSREDIRRWLATPALSPKGASRWDTSPQTVEHSRWCRELANRPPDRHNA